MLVPTDGSDVAAAATAMDLAAAVGAELRVLHVIVAELARETGDAPGQSGFGLTLGALGVCSATLLWRRRAR